MWKAAVIGRIEKYDQMVTGFLLALGLILAGCTEKEARLPINTPEQLGRTVFESLQANDMETYLRLFPTQEELAEIAELQTATDSAKTVVLKRLQGNYPTLSAKFKPGFLFLRKQIEDAGLDWAALKIVKTNVGTTPKYNELDMASILVYLSENGGTPYLLEIKSAGKLERGWLMNRSPIW